MSLRYLIIDDEPLAHNIIIEYARDISFLKLVGQSYRATEALEFLSENEVDLLFLDIQMPKITGLEFLRTLQNKPLVIITSAFQDYALESFDLAVCDYLLKPFRFNRFLQAVNRALELKQLTQKPAPIPTQITQLVDANNKTISIKSDKKQLLMELNSIYCFESLGNYVKVWEDDKFILTPKTLSSLQNQLADDQFIRIHKSFIVNKKWVHYVEGNRVFLKNGMEIPIGKSFKGITKKLVE